MRTSARLLRTTSWSGLLPDEREAIFGGGIAAADRLKDKTEVALLYAARAAECWSLGLFTEMADARDMMVALAERYPDPEVLAITGVFAETAYWYEGSVAEGLRYAELTIARTEDDPDRGAAYMGASVLARGLHSRARALSLLGRPAEARLELERSVRLMRDRGEVLWLPHTMTLYAHLTDLTGCDHLAAERADEAIRIVQQAGTRGAILTSALEAHALVALLAGRHEDAAEEFSRALLEARQSRSGLCAEASLLAYLARAHLGRGDDAGARATADEAVDVARRQGARVFELQARLIRGRILADHADLRTALSLVGETGAVAYEPFCIEELARLDADRAGLEEASRQFAAVGATGHARRLAAELA